MSVAEESVAYNPVVHRVVGNERLRRGLRLAGSGRNRLQSPVAESVVGPAGLLAAYWLGAFEPGVADMSRSNAS